MKVCLFYKKVPGKFWVTEVSMVNGVVNDIQTCDCVPKYANHGAELKPLDMTAQMAKEVVRYLEEKASVLTCLVVRPEAEKYHK